MRQQQGVPFLPTGHTFTPGQGPTPNYSVGAPGAGGVSAAGGGMSALGLGAGLGGILGGLFGGGGANPAGAAGQYLSQIPGLFDPYQQAGLGALPALQEQYGMLADPSQVGNIQALLGGSYEQSPGFQYSLDQALKGIDRSSAAGGMLGTPGAMQASADTAQQLASRDYSDYLNRQLGLYGQGLQGQQGLYQTGFGATQGIANALQSQAQLEYERQAAENARRAQTGGGIGGIIGGLIPKIPGLGWLG